MEWFTVVLVLPLKNKKECVVDIGEEHGANQSMCVCVYVCVVCVLVCVLCVCMLCV